MTTKQELLSALQNKYPRVSGLTDVTDSLSGNDKAQIDSLGARLYRVNYLDADGNKGTIKGLNVVVLNNGTADEDAVPQGRDPLETAPVRFQDEARAYIKANLPASAVKVNVLEISDEERYAIIKLFLVNQDDKIAEMKVLVYDNGTEITHKVFA